MGILIILTNFFIYNSLFSLNAIDNIYFDCKIICERSLKYFNDGIFKKFKM